MLIRKPSPIPYSEVTPKRDYLNRRKFLSGVGAAAVGLTATSRVQGATKLNNVTKSPLSTTGETLTPLEAITGYNNFYEFGTAKGDPAKNAGNFKTSPWTISIEGEAKARTL